MLRLQGARVAPAMLDARRMAAALSHRGPDGQGGWADTDAGIALAHARLAVIDTGPGGEQPMRSHDRRLVLTYNGEIYNHRRLRPALEKAGVRFRGHCDSEVLLETCAAHGVRDALDRLEGMFALAIWDAARRELWLARDRLGKKPLYYGVFAGYLLFGSELAALRAHPAFTARIDPESVGLYLELGNVPGERSIYEGVRKLGPGRVLRVPAATPTIPAPQTYWSAVAVARAGLADPFTGDEAAAVDAVATAVDQAVADRLEADVPLGALLSGGIDSTTVVESAQRQSASPIRTFTIGFGDRDYDESSDAARIATHLGTRHETLTASPDDALAAVADLPSVYDEPFADASMLPTLLVSRLARRHVTVALSGDGGDELFAGYNRHHWLPRMGALGARVPAPLRGLAAAAIRTPSPHVWDRLAGGLGFLAPRLRRQRLVGERLHKLAAVLDAPDLASAYRRTVALWPPGRVWHGPTPSAEDAETFPGGPVEQVMLRDTVGYLPDDILVKVDRASMSTGLEARAPLLDHRLLALAWRLPLAMRLRDGVGKWVLREALARRVPRSLFERPKAGFAVPIGDWLRGPLRDWAEALLAPERLATWDGLDVAAVRAAWAAHLARRANAQYALWAVLMLESWRERWHR
ncbi:MAG: asparagine synthase (glutamine-hydrolyzing) [Ectothiorhodospiraceae bacterium]|nr:asparagine synthase (glutamine-hydrolyzing) [Ectothiorhodospiraceae bacterium]